VVVKKKECWLAAAFSATHRVVGRLCAGNMPGFREEGTLGAKRVRLPYSSGYSSATWKRPLREEHTGHMYCILAVSI
jgi:hypothetical protein